MLRLGQGFFIRRTRLGRTGHLRVRHLSSILPRVSAPRRAPRCASLSALTGRGLAFTALGLGRTSQRMLSRAHFCIHFVVLGSASWHRFFPLRFSRRVKCQRSSLAGSFSGMDTGIVHHRLPLTTGSSSGCVVGGSVRCEQVWRLVQ